MTSPDTKPTVPDPVPDALEVVDGADGVNAQDTPKAPNAPNPPGAPDAISTPDTPGATSEPGPTSEPATAPTDGADATPPNGNVARYRRPEGPRRVRHGIKLSRRDGVIPRNVTDEWRSALDAVIEAPELVDGLEYARSGQIVSLRVEPGALVGKVQCTAARPHETELRFPAFSEDQWAALIDAMASEAVYLVKLLAKELPEPMEDLLQQHGLRLVPGAAEITIACNCDAGKPCRHAAALGLILADQLSSQPMLLFTLRGLDPEVMLERLRQARTLKTRGIATAHIDPMLPDSTTDHPPLEVCVDSYWRSPVVTTEEPATVKHVPHALLRRLGPSPLVGGFPLVGLLASVYDVVTEEAVRLRDLSAEKDEPDEADESE